MHTTSIVPGPMVGTRLTEAYARAVARSLFLWAWPMVNVYNRRIGFATLAGPGRLGGVLPAAPPNRLSMLTDYVEPDEREVACPNQDVVYGGGPLALDIEPVVIQVPDFGDRYWVYQIVDLRTDSFAALGSVHGSAPGFYLLAGPDWQGQLPRGISALFQSRTRSGFVIPRLFQDDTPTDRAAIQSLVNQIDMYPLSEFDGRPKQRDWTRILDLPAPPPTPDGGESPKVDPLRFWDEIAVVLADAEPLPGEASRYAEVAALLDAAARDPAIKAAITDEAVRAQHEVIEPLREFRNFGLPLAHHWTTIRNGATFGTDYFTRAAVARACIFVNKPEEAMYFFLDLDAQGERLQGSGAYTITFPAGEPPVDGFWSLTLYDAQHFFAPNALGRYSLGTKNHDLIVDDGGAVTLHLQPDPPLDPRRHANWLPSPAGQPFSLCIRAYGPCRAILDGSWSPPAVLPGPGR